MTEIASKSILIVEDEPDIAKLIAMNLRQEGYCCVGVQDGRSALAQVERQIPDLIILDRMLLPGFSGDEVLRRLKQNPRTAAIPVLIMTAKGEEADELVGFSLGADDYMVKPVKAKLLLARVAALLRRAEGWGEDPEVLALGPIVVDSGRHEVAVFGRPVQVTATEFRLMQALMAANGRVLSRNSLIDKVLGDNAVVTDRTIDVHITGLRRKLTLAGGDADASRWIQTIRGVGYTFRAPEE